MCKVLSINGNAWQADVTLHIQLRLLCGMAQERLDSSGRGRNDYANYTGPDDQDGPGPGTSAQGAPDPGARLRHALSRNTLLPQDVPSTSEGATTPGSKPDSTSQGETLVL